MKRWKFLATTLAMLVVLACSVVTQNPTDEITPPVQATTDTTDTPNSPPEYTEIPINTPLSSESPGKGCALPESGFEIGLVTRVIDGDTIEARIGDATFSVRYIGIDTPEANEPGGSAATIENQNWVADQIILLVKDTSDRDVYDRLLRYVYLEDGTFVNEELVRSGCAEPYPYPPDISCQEVLSKARLEAPGGGCKIVVMPTATGPLPSTSTPPDVILDVACSQFDAPGNDNENKNEEYVCLSNRGGAEADLTGWTLHDTYGWTYNFTEFSLQSGGSVKIRTGCGEDSELDLFWCKDETAVWNNDGDCVYLINREGEEIVNYCYPE